MSRGITTKEKAGLPFPFTEGKLVSAKSTSAAICYVVNFFCTDGTTAKIVWAT